MYMYMYNVHVRDVRVKTGVDSANHPIELGVAGRAVMLGSINYSIHRRHNMNELACSPSTEQFGYRLSTHRSV